MAKPDKDSLLEKLKMTFMGFAATISLNSFAQSPKTEQKKENPKEILITPENREIPISNEELSKVQAQAQAKIATKNQTAAKSSAGNNTAFEELEELPYGLMNQQAVYVMSASDWRKQGKIDIKRVDKNKIANYDLVSVMEAREGKKGDLINKNKAGTRMFMFQSTPAMGKYFVSYLYCSNNEALHNFASKYVEHSLKNQKALNNVQKYLYNENGELKTGLSGTLERQEAIKEMMKIDTRKIGDKTYYNAFIEDFTKLTKKEHDAVLNAQKEFIVGIYPLIGTRTNQMAKSIEKLAKGQGKRDGSCLQLGYAGNVVASKIARGAGSEGLLKETKVINKAKEVNKTDFVTLEAARQMAICGINGADEMYAKFKQKADEYQNKMEEYVKEQTTPDLTQKPDAIKDYHKEADMQKNETMQPQHRNLDFQKMFMQKNSGR